MKRLSQLALCAILFAACGGEESSETKQAKDPGADDASVTEPKVDAKETAEKSDWPLLGDGIPETDESAATTSESGLTIVVTEKGTGAAVSAGDLVAVHYHGWLAADGTQFDSSAKRGEPITFPLGAGRVIPGWDEGVAAMTIGSKARLRIPFDLAYGEKGRGPIPAKSDLVFDVWLVGSFSEAKDGIPEIDESTAKTSPTGLVKIPMTVGNGQVVGTSTASVHYHGWLASDGSLFDSSARRGQPISFPVGVGMVIPGWDEGISEMKVGEKARFRIPSALAYGDRSPGAAIPANSDLVFDVWVVGAKSTPTGMPTGHP
jgi:FKBP-type peptidyl-prolyl cis-trans isomerase